MRRLSSFTMAVFFKITMILCISSILLAFTESNDLKKKNLKGKVKAYTYHEYEIKLDSIPLIKLIRIEHLSYNNEGYRTGHQEIKQDENNVHTFKNIKKVNEILDSVIGILQKDNQQGTYRASDKYIKYNMSGNKIETISADEYGVKYLEKFDKKGRLIERDVYYPEGRIDKYIQASNKNSDISKVYLYKNDSLVDKSIHRYTYDKIGNWVTDSIFDNDTLTHIKKQEFEYW